MSQTRSSYEPTRLTAGQAAARNARGLQRRAAGGQGRGGGRVRRVRVGDRRCGPRARCPRGSHRGCPGTGTRRGAARFPGAAAADAAPLGEVFITATGSAEVITAEHLAVMAVAMHTGVRPHADAYELPAGRRLLLLAGGRVVNVVAAGGHPPEVMDVAFGIEALTLPRLAGSKEQLSPGVHRVPPTSTPRRPGSSSPLSAPGYTR